MSGWYVLADAGRVVMSGPWREREEAEELAEQMECDGGVEYEVAYINDVEPLLPPELRTPKEES